MSLRPFRKSWRALRRGLVLFAAGLVSLECAAPPPAELTVEFLGGSAASDSPEPSRPRVEVLLDQTASLREAGPRGAAVGEAARAAAVRFVRTLPDGTGVGLNAFGVDPGECHDVRRVAYSEFAPPRDDLAGRIRALRSAGEGSLAGALTRLTDGLREGGALEGARVVVFTDLGAECGGDFCEAANTLVSGGAHLDLVVLGDAPTPACLDGLTPPLDASPIRVASPSFEVETRDSSEAVSRGRVNHGAVAVPAGDATVVVDLIPPLRLERRFGPGTRVRLRVLDFPSQDPSARAWDWSVRESNRR